MDGVKEYGGFRVGDLVRKIGSPVVYRLEIINPPAPPIGVWASFMPVKKDGTRDRRRTPFGGRLDGFEKVEMK